MGHLVWGDTRSSGVAVDNPAVDQASTGSSQQYLRPKLISVGRVTTSGGVSLLQEGAYESSSGYPRARQLIHCSSLMRSR